MDLVLLTLTVVSLAAAAGFGASAWRAAVEQRRRSAARVAALASAIDAPDAMAGVAVAPQPVPVPPRAEHAGARDECSSRRDERTAPVAVPSLFGTMPGSAVRGHPLIKGAVAAAMTVALIVAGAMASRDALNGPRATQNKSPVELISLRHVHDGDTLTVTGLIRNPPAGAAVTGVDAVVFTFDRSGTFVVSSSAPLDFRTLAPGDQSPFAVEVPAVREVSRYRVSFRTDSGVMRHIDRRAGSAAVGPAPPPGPGAH